VRDAQIFRPQVLLVPALKGPKRWIQRHTISSVLPCLPYSGKVETVRTVTISLTRWARTVAQFCVVYSQFTLVTWFRCTDVIRRNLLVKSLVRAKIVHNDFTWASIEIVRFSYPNSQSSEILDGMTYDRNRLRRHSVSRQGSLVVIFGTPIR